MHQRIRGQRPYRPTPIFAVNLDGARSERNQQQSLFQRRDVGDRRPFAWDTQLAPIRRVRCPPYLFGVVAGSQVPGPDCPAIGDIDKSIPGDDVLNAQGDSHRRSNRRPQGSPLPVDDLQLAVRDQDDTPIVREPIQEPPASIARPV